MSPCAHHFHTALVSLTILKATPPTKTLFSLFPRLLIQHWIHWLSFLCFSWTSRYLVLLFSMLTYCVSSPNILTISYFDPRFTCLIDFASQIGVANNLISWSVTLCRFLFFQANFVFTPVLIPSPLPSYWPGGWQMLVVLGMRPCPAQPRSGLHLLSPHPNHCHTCQRLMDMTPVTYTADLPASIISVPIMSSLTTVLAQEVMFSVALHFYQLWSWEVIPTMSSSPMFTLSL